MVETLTVTLPLAQALAAEARTHAETAATLLDKDPLEGGDLLRAYQACTRGIEKLEDAQRECVAALRDAGLTWDRIGNLLGITRQAAWKRFGGSHGLTR